MTVLHFAISPISKLTSIWSPEVFIHGIPWQIQVCKNQEEHSLAVYLRCAKKDGSSDWEVPACFTMYLLPIGDDKPAHKNHISPYVFHPTGCSFGIPVFIEWADLMNVENKFVRDDTIQLKIEITAEDPNFLAKSILNFDCIDKSCDCGSLATFRLTVENMENLMTVHSPKFNLRGLPWDLTVYKEQTSTLGVMLEAKKSSKKVSCEMTMSVKLVSSKNDVDPVEKSLTNHVQWPGNIEIPDVIPWDELCNPENGFVNNQSTTLEVELKAGKPEKPKSLKRLYSSV